MNGSTRDNCTILAADTKEGPPRTLILFRSCGFIERDVPTLSESECSHPKECHHGDPCRAKPRSGFGQLCLLCGKRLIMDGLGRS